jgi:hypothetical protein
MNTWVKRARHWIGVLVITVFGLLVVLYLVGEIAGPLLYRIPSNHRGWVAIRYDDPGCPPLRQEGWSLVIPLDRQGGACTSSPPPGGWRYWRFEYISADARSEQLSGLYKDVWGGSISGPHPPRIATFFIGSKEDLEASSITEWEFRRKIESSYLSQKSAL